MENQIKNLAKLICPTHGRIEACAYCSFPSCVAEAYAERILADGYVKQQHGEWIYSRDSNGLKTCKCSKCLTSHGHLDTPYCPNCGAKMKGTINND